MPRETFVIQRPSYYGVMEVGMRGLLNYKTVPLGEGPPEGQLFTDERRFKRAVRKAVDESIKA